VAQDDATADLFRAAVEQYGHRLTSMTADSWERAVVYPGGNGHVTRFVTEVSLPDEDGYGDLTLTLETNVTPDGATTTRAVDLRVL